MREESVAENMFVIHFQVVLSSHAVRLGEKETAVCGNLKASEGVRSKSRTVVRLSGYSFCFGCHVSCINGLISTSCLYFGNFLMSYRFQHSTYPRNLPRQYGQTSNSLNSASLKLGPSCGSSFARSRNSLPHREQYLEMPGSWIARNDIPHLANV